MPTSSSVRYPGRSTRSRFALSHPPLMLSESSTLSSGVFPSSTQPDVCGILLSPHRSARRIGVQVHPPRKPGPERSEKRVAGIRGLDPPSQRIGRVPQAQLGEGQELGDALLPGPVSFARPPPRTEPSRRAEDHHRDKCSREERSGSAAHHSCSAATG